MVDADRIRRLFTVLERYRSLLAQDEPEGHRVPRDYGDAFRVLAEVGVLDDALADRMVALAGARNLIVDSTT